MKRSARGERGGGEVCVPCSAFFHTRHSAPPRRQFTHAPAGGQHSHTHTRTHARRTTQNQSIGAPVFCPLAPPPPHTRPAMSGGGQERESLQPSQRGRLWVGGGGGGDGGGTAMGRGVVHTRPPPQSSYTRHSSASGLSLQKVCARKEERGERGVREGRVVGFSPEPPPRPRSPAPPLPISSLPSFSFRTSRGSSFLVLAFLWDSAAEISSTWGQGERGAGGAGA